MKKIYLAFIFLLVLWTALSAGRIIFNLSKIFTVERGWIFMSDYQKREELYGDVFPIYNKINSLTNHEDIVNLISNDGKPYFILRFLLYPKKVFWFTSPEKIPTKNKNSFVIFYHEQVSKDFANHKKIYSFETNNHKSFIYKL
jgi:hypothetical protein